MQEKHWLHWATKPKERGLKIYLKITKVRKEEEGGGEEGEEAHNCFVFLIFLFSGSF